MHHHTNQQRCETIIEYVRRNPKTTKRKLVKSLDDKKLSSLLTTRKLLEELISSGTVKVTKDRPDGRNHYLRINDESLFNRYSQNLPDIEKHIDSLQTMGREADLIMWNLAFKLDLVNKLPFEKDAQILNQKILKLLLKLAAKKVKAVTGAKRKINQKRLISERENHQEKIFMAELKKLGRQTFQFEK